MTFGLHLLLRGVAQFLVGKPDFRPLDRELAGRRHRGEARRVPKPGRLADRGRGIGVVLVTLAVHQFPHRTKWARGVEATAAGQGAAQLMGISISCVTQDAPLRAFVRGTGAACAGAGRSVPLSTFLSDLSEAQASRTSSRCLWSASTSAVVLSSITGAFWAGIMVGVIVR
jgi:branched-subunit amino acid ABC-type transport system permease component